jgi:hypothetical protein
MSLDDYRDPDPDCNWTALLKEKAEHRGLNFEWQGGTNDYMRFHIASDNESVLGAVHHSRKTDRSTHIYMDYSEELAWLHDESDPPFNTAKNDVEILSVVIDLQSEGEYTEKDHDFLILTEDVLREFPESGKKPIRVDAAGYPHPFDKHLNSWTRVFRIFQ